MEQEAKIENKGKAKVNISFDTLFEILRKERNKEDLSEIPENYFLDVLALINNKVDTLNQMQSQKSNVYSNEEIEYTRIMVNNIKRLVIEIYERREKKIINMALNKSRTKSTMIDNSALLSAEKGFFDEMVRLFDSYRSDVLLGLIGEGSESRAVDRQKAMRQPVVQQNFAESRAAEGFAEGHEASEGKAETSHTASTYAKDVVKDDGDVSVRAAAGSHSSHESEMHDLASQETKKQTKISKTVRFAQAVPKFLGRELEVYGPFSEDDMASLPTEIADVLIKKGRAEEVF